MAQFARPDSNVTQTGFTGGFADIDETSASDADFAYTNDNTTGLLEVGLSDVNDPSLSTDHVLRYRLAKADTGVPPSTTGNTQNGTVSLYQGATLIAADAERTLGAWTDYSLTLSGAQADAITDYTDLRIRFDSPASGGGPTGNRRGGAISWAELEVPDGPVTVEDSFTADAHISKNDIAGTFTADANIRRDDIAGSFTADAHISKLDIAQSFTADSHISKFDIVATFAADANISKTDIAQSLTADAYVLVIRPGTFTADGHISATVAGSFTADADIQVSGTVVQSFTADAHISKTGIEQTFTADAAILVTQPGSLTADAYISATFFGSFTADAHIASTVGGTFTADAHIQVIGTIAGSFTTDAYIRTLGVAGSFTADSYIRTVNPATFTADAYILASQIASLLTLTSKQQSRRLSRQMPTSVSTSTILWIVRSRLEDPTQLRSGEIQQ